jgi:hypothetical protein
MDTVTTTAMMAEEMGRVRNSALFRAFGWEIDVEALVAYVRMRPRKKKDRLFLLRITFDEFPRRAPSFVFVDCQSRQLTQAAWPPDVQHSSNPPGICTPGTREFHENYHRNDAQYPWSADRFTVLQTLTEIHRLMERGLGG